MPYHPKNFQFFGTPDSCATKSGLRYLKYCTNSNAYNDNTELTSLFKEVVHILDIRYEEEFSKRKISGKEYTITNLIPKLKDEHKQQIKDEIKKELFKVFKKYV